MPVISANALTLNAVHRHSITERADGGKQVEYVGPPSFKPGTEERNHLSDRAKDKLTQVALELAGHQFPTMKVTGHWDWDVIHHGVTVLLYPRGDV